MDDKYQVQLKVIPTSVPNLDVVLGGGLPAYSTSLVAGPPGVGKTTLVQQIIHHNATPDAKALYFTALGEPAIKILRYQQQFTFFDPRKVGSAVIYLDLGGVVREQGLAKALDFIRQHVEKQMPAFLVVDSFKSVQEFGAALGGNIRVFVHDLANLLAFWETTSFLLGEYTEEEILTIPEASVADNILWLDAEVHGNTVLNKLRVVKVRGQAPQRAKHTFAINQDGLTVYPRLAITGTYPQQQGERSRVKFGIPSLDQMLHGGIPRGESTIIAGSSGTGKTLLSLHFIAEGVARGEPGVMVTFEESPREHETKAAMFGWDLQAWQAQGLLAMIYLRPLDLSADVVLNEVHQQAVRLGAKRVVFNSVSGFLAGLAEVDRTDFKEALYRLVASLTSEGITTVLTTEIPGLYGELQVSPEGISFLADNFVVLRYAEIDSQLRKVIMVVKMRTSDHDKDLRQYTITGKGIQIEQPLEDYTGILSGIPTPKPALGPQPYVAGLTPEEQRLVRAVMASGQATAGEVAARVGIDERAAQDILDRLADLGYLIRGGTKTKPAYRVAIAMPGAR